MGNTLGSLYACPRGYFERGVGNQELQYETFLWSNCPNVWVAPRIALLFLEPLRQVGVGGQHASADLRLEKRLRYVGAYFETHKGAINPTPPKKEQGSSCVISALFRGVNEFCVLLEFYAAQNGSFLATFRDNLSVPSKEVKQFFDCLTFELGPIDCPETSIMNYRSRRRKIQNSADIINLHRCRNLTFSEIINHLETWCASLYLLLQREMKIHMHRPRAEIEPAAFTQECCTNLGVLCLSFFLLMSEPLCCHNHTSQ